MNTPNWQSVADRICELERQQSISSHNEPYSYLDPSKLHRVSNPALKAFQKNAVQSYFARQKSFKESSHPQIRNNAECPVKHAQRPQSLQLNMTQSNTNVDNRSSLPENLLSKSSNQSQPILCNISSSKSPLSYNNKNNFNSKKNNESVDIDEKLKKINSPRSNSNPVVPSHNYPPNMNYSKNYLCETPPPPPPRNRTSLPARRTSSASEYASSRDQINLKLKQNLSEDLLRPMIMGPIISVDEWVPERPPKKTLLRIPSPELPPPPPLNVIETDGQHFDQDAPLPPPPPELMKIVRQMSEPENKPAISARRNSFAGQTNNRTPYRSSPLETVKPPTLIPRIHNSEKVHSSLAHNDSNGINYNHTSVIKSKSMKTLHTNSTRATINPFVDSRLSIRKRTHNGQSSIELPIPGKGIVTSPPPLKPKMSVFSGDFKFNNAVSR